MLRRNINSRGDTIVEVMIALAVLSLAFVISYATANRALTDSQNSQEHSTALEYIDGQLEALRYYSQQPGQTLSSTTFAFYLKPDTSTRTVQLMPAPDTILGSGFVYSISIWPPNTGDPTIKCLNPTRIPNTYIVTVTWPGLGKLGEQCEALSDRIY